jgi:hypothetical protein
MNAAVVVRVTPESTQLIALKGGGLTWRRRWVPRSSKRSAVRLMMPLRLATAPSHGICDRRREDRRAMTQVPFRDARYQS